MATNRKMRLCTEFSIRDSKIRERILKAFQKYAETNGIKIDIHFDADDEEDKQSAEYNTTVRVSIYGSSEECETASDKLLFMIPESERTPEEFIAPDDHNWQKRYSEYRRILESD